MLVSDAWNLEPGTWNLIPGTCPMETYLPYLNWIDSQEQHMIHTVEQWSRINSGSYHLEGLERMCKALSDHFHWLQGKQEILSLPPLKSVDSRGEEVEIPVGKALRIRKRPSAPIQVFLCGHMDTVFGKDHPFQEPKYLDEKKMNGPGVADLKGGLVVMLKALEAFERSPWVDQLGWEVLLNPDEEIGSQSSDFLLKEAAERNHLGLIYEPAMEDGTMAGARKGSGNFSVVVRGVAAHAGREFHLGRNAIVAAAEYVQMLNVLNGKRDGVTVNVGKIEGGGALNIVPDLAIVRYNVRTKEVADMAWMEKEIKKIQALFEGRNGISVAHFGKFTRAPKPIDHPNQKKLMNLVVEQGKQLGLTIGWKATGGCCDGNNLWAHGLPNVDTMGVRGGAIHSDREFVWLDSLTERAKLSALILMQLASGEISWT